LLSISLPDAQPKADALVTKTPGLVLGTLAADCTPILLADGRAGVIAVAHAGWKGALGGIAEATVTAMEQAGARRQDIVAAVGPCIGKDAYEVGPKFKAAFLALDQHYARFFSTSSAGARPKFDLAGFVANRLTVAGIGRVEEMAICTYAHPDRFFSYRRMTHAGQLDYGRQVSALVLT
jgi:polyphenol oxidase